MSYWQESSIVSFFSRNFSLSGWCYHCGSYLKNPDPGCALLCLECASKLPFLDHEICPVCGKKHRDIDCEMDWKEDIDRFYAVFLYREPLNIWISRFKYHRNIFSGRIMRNLLMNWMSENLLVNENFDQIIPIPIHWWSLLLRGFNQTDFLISNKLTNKDISRDILKKRKYFPRQTTLKSKARLKNLKGAFTADQECKGKNILLFDDVCTSGRTLSAAAKELKKAGASKISVLVLCRNL